MANDHDDLQYEIDYLRSEATRLGNIATRLNTAAVRLERLNLPPVVGEPSFMEGVADSVAAVLRAEQNRNPMCRSVVVPVAEENPGSKGCVVCGEPIVFRNSGDSGRFCTDDRDNSIWHYECNAAKAMRDKVAKGRRLIVRHRQLSERWSILVPEAQFGIVVIDTNPHSFSAVVQKIRGGPGAPFVTPNLAPGMRYPTAELRWDGLLSVEVDGRG